MSGGRIDDLSVLAVLAAAGLVLVLLVRAQPRRALLVFVLVLCFVPYWVGAQAGPFVPALVAIGMVLVAVLAWDGLPRPAVPDVLLALVVGTALASFALGIVSLSTAYSTVVEWTVPYILGRIIASRVAPTTAATLIAVPFVVVGALAVVEFATGSNVFHGLRASNSLYTIWGTQQFRGGLARAEGAFGHSIALGASLAMAVPMVWASRMRTTWKMLALAVVLAGAVVSLSRIGMVTAVLALVLCVATLPRHVALRARPAVVAILAAGGVVAIPYLARVFSDAGQEAQGSASYRTDLMSLLPHLNLLGESSSRLRDATGAVTVAGFRSVDNAFLLIGLTLGLLPLGLLLLAATIAVLRVAQPAPSPALVAVVASLPALTSVALITQYTVLFWFMAGMAATAAPTPHRASRQSSNAPAHRTAPSSQRAELTLAHVR